MSDLTGQDIGRYHIIERLGEGGMAVVYKAFDMRLKRDVAIKFIRTDAIPPNQLAKMLARFEREAQALARMEHLHIIRIFDYGEHDGAPYLVMNYLQGGTLKQYAGRPMEYHSAVKLILPVARALEYAHEQGVVHRDVKPANILISKHGEPMLSDFGIARMLENDGGTLTGTGVGIGTPEYMAPEQWRGEVGPAVDIYALGIVLYELITGRPPYQADTPVAIFAKQLTDPLPRPATLVSGLPEDIENLLFKALAKNPGDRYSTMGEMIQAMEVLLHQDNQVRTAVTQPAIPVSTTEAEIHLQERTPASSAGTTPRNHPSKAEKGQETLRVEGVAPATVITEEASLSGIERKKPEAVSQNVPEITTEAGKSRDGFSIPRRYLVIAGLLFILFICLVSGGWLISEGASGRGVLSFLQSPTSTSVPVPATATQLKPTFTPLPPTHTSTPVKPTDTLAPTFTSTATSTHTPTATITPTATLTGTPTRTRIPYRSPTATKEDGPSGPNPNPAYPGPEQSTPTPPPF